MDGKFVIQTDEPILVTGAAGFIGAKVVEVLLEYGFSNVRCFVRPSSGMERLQMILDKSAAGTRASLVSGDLLSRQDCVRATESVSLVYHLAAGQDKSFAGAYMNCALATRNLLDAFLDRGRPRRFVNLSSFAVYSNATLKRGAVLDESAPLEDAPHARWDAYGFGKLKQEELVREYGRTRGLAYVILRPGTVYGPGKTGLSGRVGIDTFGFFVHLGGANQLPLTYVDNCAEAVVLGGLVPGVDGEVFNVVDDETLTSAQFLRAYKRRVGRFFSLRIPYPVAYGFSRLWEEYSRRSQGQLPPVFNRRRCAAEWKGNRYTNYKLREKLRWTPRVGVHDAMSAYLAQFHDNR
jgi:nucleoside-diphosphate-sugar epimerase